MICGDRAPCIRDRHGWASLERNFPSAAIWCWLLWRFSRVKARLVPTHPDGCGGLVLLAMPGPLLAFSGQLVNARLIGLERYEHLALDYTTGFDDRWIAHAREDDLLGTADIQSRRAGANSSNPGSDHRHNRPAASLARRLQSWCVPLSADQIAALAPDAKALAAGKQSAAPRLWDALGRSDVAMWGECKGSAVYQIRVALDDLVAKCSCPSRKFPCKHSLGLLFLAAESPDRVPVAKPPDWVTEWLEKRAESPDRKKQRAEKAADAAPPDPEQQAKRAEKRLARVLAGIEALELWLTVICLLALNDQGAPMFDARHAATLASLDIPTFACTPDAFPEMIAAALAKRDVGQWASSRGIVGAK